MAVLALLGLIGIGATLKFSHDADVRTRNEAASSSSVEQAAADRTAAERSKQRKAEDDRIAAERAERALTVVQIQSSVKSMAEDHVARGIVDGPILSVTCDPVGGGSTDDLTAKTTIFECFAANQDNGDGTMLGRKYHATMNWSTGNFTYGLGAP